MNRWVESIWYARGTVPYQRERIAPTGSTVAVIVLGDPIIETADDGEATPVVAERGFLLGPHDRPVVNEPTGETFALGIVTTPVGCQAVFGLEPSALRGRAVVLEDVWPLAVGLRDDLLDVDDPEDMLDAVAAAIEPGSPPSGVARCERAVAALEADPTRPIADIAAELGVSHGHLDREVQRIVGLSPRRLARLLRVRRLLASLDVSRPIAWSDLAAAGGWFDQAHMIRDFKRHTGVSPSNYVAAQRSAFPAGAVTPAPGFVPEAEARDVKSVQDQPGDPGEVGSLEDG